MSASPRLLFIRTFLQPALSILGSSQIFLTILVYLFLLMRLHCVTVQSRLMRLMLLSLAWLRESPQVLMVCQMEFYVALWDLLGDDLVNVLNASLEADLLPFSQGGALIALILKKGDRLDHKNWPPISLLNVDYKLCARVLAGRLLKLIASVVAPDQTCGVPGRYIGENVAFLRDVVELANEYNLPVALLSLDQGKAFDLVDWPFLFTTLAKMGFGDNFIRWVRLLYTDVRSSVLVNGYTSRPFKPSRGVGQGCPLSPPSLCSLDGSAGC